MRASVLVYVQKMEQPPQHACCWWLSIVRGLGLRASLLSLSCIPCVYWVDIGQSELISDEPFVLLWISSYERIPLPLPCVSEGSLLTEEAYLRLVSLLSDVFEQSIDSGWARWSSPLDYRWCKIAGSRYLRFAVWDRSLSDMWCSECLTWVVCVWLSIFLFRNAHLEMLFVLHKPDGRLPLLHLSVEIVDRLEEHRLCRGVTHDFAL